MSKCTSPCLLALTLIGLLSGCFGDMDGIDVTPIVNGYEYLEPDGDAQSISYKDENGRRMVLASRVYWYEIDGDNLIVARKRKIIEVENGVGVSRFSANCEYWSINTITHEMTLTSIEEAASCHRKDDDM